MKNIIKLNVIFLVFLIIFSSHSIASDSILPLPRPIIDKETKEIIAKKKIIYPKEKPQENKEEILIDAAEKEEEISEDSKGEVYIQEHKVVFDKLIPKILAISNNRTDTRIYVRGDKTINYGRVLEVMGMLSGAGFSKVALISEPYKN